MTFTIFLTLFIFHPWWNKPHTLFIPKRLLFCTRGSESQASPIKPNISLHFSWELLYLALLPESCQTPVSVLTPHSDWLIARQKGMQTTSLQTMSDCFTKFLWWLSQAGCLERRMSEASNKSNLSVLFKNFLENSGRENKTRSHKKP